MKTIELQIQFGQRKGKILRYPALPGLRPTLGRVRDVLFNWVQKLPEFTCLDAFAGTGILGIQALCLGAKHVDFIENQGPLMQCIENNLRQIQYYEQSQLHTMNALNAVNSLSKSYDMIFLDPPFENIELAQKLWDALLDRKLLNPRALVYLEIPKNSELVLNCTTQLKHKQIGDVWIYLLQYQ